ncbi:hypothetical protein [Kitasatospora sp. NPDC096140]|uniref:hypothetical protein n=1 Tax=unclassified Kitasatospora TaxID=2633591 RepID=UPI0033169EBD
MNAPDRLPKPAPALPAQARPVRRDGPGEPAHQRTGPGVEAALSQCAGMPGLARQMCYAAQYGT